MCSPRSHVQLIVGVVRTLCCDQWTHVLAWCDITLVVYTGNSSMHWRMIITAYYIDGKHHALYRNCWNYSGIF